MATAAEVDVGEVGAVLAGIIVPPAVAEVTVGQGVAVAVVEEGAVMAVVLNLNTVEVEDTPAEEEDGGKSNNRCWSGRTSSPMRESAIPASSNKFPFSLTSRFSSTCLPGLCALLS